MKSAAVGAAFRIGAMSYLVLARKYRPKDFSQMVGQSHVVRALTNALASGRLHHAYLFTGTRGVGKTTVSRILAKSLNCIGADGQGGITPTPCGVCPICTAIDGGRFNDYIELDAASNRGVDEVQSLLEQAVYKPVEGRFKVFMIDEVHMLTGHAFNAMLKTLEEPPDYLKFVLATTDPQKVPVTVLSRCLQFNLRPMAPETVLEHLQTVFSAEQVEADSPALRLLARAARGSMRDALSLADQAIAFGNGALREAEVRQMLGSADRAHVFALIEALATSDGSIVVETIEALRRDGLSAASTLEEMTSVLQAMAVLQAVPTRADAAASGGEDTDPDAGDTRRLAASMPADETQLLYSICLHGRAELGLAPDEYAGLTMVLLRLLAFKPAVSSGAAQRRMREGKKTPETPEMPSEALLPDEPLQNAPLQNAPVPKLAESAHFKQKEPETPALLVQAATNIVAIPVRVQAPEKPREASDRSATLSSSSIESASVVSNEEGDFWHAVVTAMVNAEAVSALARELALQSQLVGRDVDQWLLRIDRESLNSPVSRERLQAALAAQGHAVRLVVEIGRVSDSPARRLAHAAAERQRAAEETVRNDPLVQAMMRDYDAKIVPGSLRPI